MSDKAYLLIHAAIAVILLFTTWSLGNRIGELEDELYSPVTEATSSTRIELNATPVVKPQPCPDFYNIKWTDFTYETVCKGSERERMLVQQGYLP